MAIDIREAKTSEDRRRAFELRYLVQVDELGRAPSGPGTDEGQLRDGFDEHAQILIAEDNGELVGTVRKTYGQDGPLEMEDEHEFSMFGDYYPSRCAMTSKLVVAPSHRGTSVVGRLSFACYEHGRRRGVVFDFVDTRPHLVRLYQQLGYRFFRSNIDVPGAGSVIPMVILSEDAGHMERVRSPFRRIARKFENNDAAKQFFEEHFPEYAGIVPSFSLGEERLWESWGRSILEGGEVSGFFKGFDEDEVRRFLRQLDPVDYPSGAAIVQQGDASEGMFCLLEGQAEVVVCGVDGAEATVDILNPGEVFGEMSFVTGAKRNATVRTRADSTVFVLTGSEFAKLEKTEPALALKLMTNLFSSVVERFEAKRDEVVRLRATR